MPIPGQGNKGISTSACNIRKRGCSSTSSSSSLLHNYRLKRSLFTSKRWGGTTTPVPAWKMADDSQVSTADASEFQLRFPHSDGKGAQGPVSARKLANALWELNEKGSSLGFKNEVSRRNHMAIPKPGSVHSDLSDPSHSPMSKMMDHTGFSVRRRKSMSLFPEKTRFNELSGRPLEVELRSRSLATTTTNSVEKGKSKNCLKSLSNSLHASRQLVKILGHAMGHDEHMLSSLSIISVLRVELAKANEQVDQLIEEQRLDVGSTYAKGTFVEEKFPWERKEKESVLLSVRSMREELELEKKLRKKSERINKKLYTELSDTKSALSKANKELETERRSRKQIKRVCDDLVNGIGHNKAEMEELKREAAKVWEELEKEREMLHLADLWREERVQMKLSDARFVLEEKNAAVDQLRNELETYLTNKRLHEDSIGHRNPTDEANSEDLSKSWITDVNAHDQKGKEADSVYYGEDNSEADSVASDLQSIELNMDNNSKSYKWNFTSVEVQENAESTNDDNENNKKRNTSQGNHTLIANLLLGRSTSLVGPEWISLTKRLENSISENEDNNIDAIEEKQNKKLNPDTERYKSVKSLRDKMLSSSKIKRGLSSPTRPCVQPQNSVATSEQGYVGAKVSEMLRTVSDIGSSFPNTGSQIGNHSIRQKPLLIAMEK